MPHSNPNDRKEYRKKHYAENREQYIREAAEWKRNNRERINAGERAKRRVRTDARRVSERAYYEANKDRIRAAKRAARRKYYAENRDRILEVSKTWWHRLTPDQKRARSLKVNYDLSLADYNDMLARQGGGCAICGSPLRLHVDHDHTAVGLLGEDVKRIVSAARYIAAAKRRRTKMAGNQSRGLVAASITKGWNPTVIPAGNGQPAQNLADFDVDPGNLPGKRVGELPGGAVIGWPDGFGPPRDAPTPAVGSVDFESPQPDGNTPARRGGGDPYPGMPGAR